MACPIETATTTTETAPLATTCTDADSDGYGATSTDLSACTGSTTSADCNDADASIRPGATEICGDGIDQDCDGSDLACLPSGENATITGAATTVGIMLLARLLFAGLFGVQFISGPF
ncbi:MAG TPA: putative metal-binding motif-containing protein [Methylophilaceae bacterium]|nr:putative metal-binding motif-containing protein [Methylophilaceae bacterium]